MKVLILGIDGYLGWPLANYLASRGHTVAGVDYGLRRNWVDAMGSISAIPIAGMPRRRAGFEYRWERPLVWEQYDIALEYNKLRLTLDDFQPDAIVHLAECPSAPFSMKDWSHAQYVQNNNVLGTLGLLWAMRDVCREAHLVKLGTMGEYGTPNVDIPEGYFDIEYRGRKDRLPFPKQAGSWYHLSKVHDTNNIAFACKVWGLRATDLMQGVVFGTRLDELGDDPRLWTRLDFDEAFGTCLNRFCCQAVIGAPITPYGKGDQTRGFLPLRDSMECISLVIENPADPGQHRVLNQFESYYSVNDLAEKVWNIASEFHLNPAIKNIPNPRIEAEEHYYSPDRDGLVELGYRPDHDMDRDIRFMIEDLLPHKPAIVRYKNVLAPKIRWDGSR